MKQNLLKTNFLYRTWEGFPNVIRFCFRMDRPVDGHSLRRAVQESVIRYPYFCIRLERHGEEYSFFHNDAPVPVFHGNESICFGSGQTNGHFLAVSYQDDTISFYIYHNLCDARGFIPWVKTVLYLYLVKAVDPALSREGVNLPGEPFLPNETEDPFLALELPENIQPLYTQEPVPVFVPDTRYAQVPGRIDYYVRADGPEFQNLFKTMDGSPVVMTIWFLKQMIKHLFPDRGGLPIAAAIPHSLRSILSGENNYHDQLTPLMLRYDEKIDRLPLDRQFTVSRGSLFLQSMEENMLCRIKWNIDFAEELERLPTVEERRAASKHSVKQFIQNPETMCVTYPGNTQWGELGSYIRSLYMHTTVLSAPLMVVFHHMNSSFWFTFHQRDNTSAFADAFVALLKQYGIHAEVTGCAAPDDSRVYIP